jgi:hypothetical protein
MNKNNNGFVSIFSVLIIMSVLTLIMVGFSQVVRRASVSNLNDQLSTQAFYAAESGVNAAITYLKTAGAADKTSCNSGPAGSPTTSTTNLDSALQVGYTCVLISKSAPDIKFSSVPVQGTAAPKIVTLDSGNAANIPTGLDVTLGSTSGSAFVSASSGGELPQESSRPATVLGMLRVDMVPTSGSLDRAALSNGYTFFLDFSTSGTNGSANVYKGVQAGELVRVKCAAAPCKATINLNNSGSQAYSLRLQSIYSPLKVTIDKVTGPAGAIKLVNGQSIVDVTGQANSVYRRVQVRLPAEGNLSTPFSLLTADSICKKLEITPGNTTDTTCGIL